MIAWLTSLLMEWGYVGLFIAPFLSGTAFPFSSELILFGLIKLGLDPIACLISATTGNTLGGMTCYWLGHLGKMEWIERYLKVKPEKIEKTRKFLQGRGAYMAFFAFLPILGTLIAITLGYMRSNRWIVLASMTAGKLLRYIIILLLC